MKVIYNPFTPIPKSEKSHVRGWAMLWNQRLKGEIVQDLHGKPVEGIYIDHGVNFSGSLNLFGGLNEQIWDRVWDLVTMAELGVPIFSLDMKMPRYDEMLLKRKEAYSLDWQHIIKRLKPVLDKSYPMDMWLMPTDKIIIGDSHSGAYSLPDQQINRLNGMLLHRVLENGLTEFLASKLNKQNQYSEVTLCLGSVDIRHHAIRLKANPRNFAELYAMQVIDAQQELGIKINVCAPVPIEHEGRKIPKTGQYNGKNFSGTRMERLKFTLEFINKLESYLDFDVVLPPEEWYDMEGEQYAKEIMELASSVHIAPKNYRSILGW